MSINIKSGNLKQSKNLILPVLSGQLEAAVNIIPDLKGVLAEQNFTGKKGDLLVLRSTGGYKKIILVGLGDNLEAFKDNYAAMEIGGKACAGLDKFDENVVIDLEHIKGEDEAKNLALNLVTGICLTAYKYTKYFTTRETKLNELEKLSEIIVHAPEVNLECAINYATALIEGIYFTRDLVIEAPNDLYAETFVQRIKELESLGVKVEVLGEKELKELGFNLLLAVNQGSAKEAKVAIMHWNNGGSDKPIAFVGKGVTFDSGGLSLKPAGAMIGMKGDMAGAATVVGLFKTLALRKANVNAIGVVGLVENAVSGEATRPGDVVKSYSGKTVEILNTDAEGRLVLADVLAYTNDKFKPSIIIDLATLTGAIIITLGYLRAGLFSNDETLISQLMESGEASQDKLWNLPVGEEYRSMMDSEIADIGNIGTVDRAAGSVTAAIFLKEFIGNTKWAHIDIAGTSWRGTRTDRASGFGVRLLDRLVSKHYEKK